jgi:DNA-binding XRE family transcriptional regulator
MSNLIIERQLRAARILADLTQKQLAQEVGWAVDRPAAPEIAPRKPT